MRDCRPDRILRPNFSDQGTAGEVICSHIMRKCTEGLHQGRSEFTFHVETVQEVYPEQMEHIREGGDSQEREHGIHLPAHQAARFLETRYTFHPKLEHLLRVPDAQDGEVPGQSSSFGVPLWEEPLWNCHECAQIELVT